MGVSVSGVLAGRSADGVVAEPLLTEVWLSRVGDPVSTLLAPDVVVVVVGVVTVFSLELEDEAFRCAVCPVKTATGVAAPANTGAAVAALACPCSTVRVSGEGVCSVAAAAAAAPLMAVMVVVVVVVAAAGEVRCCSL